jgi:hypothetical protein
MDFLVLPLFWVALTNHSMEVVAFVLICSWACGFSFLCWLPLVCRVGLAFFCFLVNHLKQNSLELIIALSVATN